MWRTTDGGATFEKLKQGLPSGLLGRCSFDYWQKDPNVVFAIVESEMIGKAGAKVGWAGVTTSNAEVGAKVTAVTKDGPGANAGLEVGDIITRVEGNAVVTRTQFDEAIAQFEIGNVVELEIARKGKAQKVMVELGKRQAPSATAGRGRGRRGGSASRPFGTRLGGQNANIHKLQGKNGHEHGGVYRSDDGGTSWKRINSINPRPMYFSQIRVDPNDDQQLYVLGVSMAQSKDGGKTFTNDAGRGVHADQHALWINPNDSRHLLLGTDGGTYVSHDKAVSWDHLNHVSIGQFYHVGVGPRRDYWVYGGLQDNGSWGAPHRVSMGRGPINEDWIRIGGGDGFVCRVDPNDHQQLYYESQNGATQRRHLGTFESGRIRPVSRQGTARPSGAAARGRRGGAVSGTAARPRGSGGAGAAFRARRGRRGAGAQGARARGGDAQGRRRRGDAQGGRGTRGAAGRGRGRGARAAGAGRVDPAAAASGQGRPAGAQGRQVRAGQTRGRGAQRRGPSYRFNWKTPFILSHHNSRIYYNAGNHVFRSLDRGNDLRPISPEITRGSRGSATALAESPRDHEILYVGTDDGALWGTTDGGKTWQNLWADAEENITDDERGAPTAPAAAKPLSALVPGPRWVSSLAASRHSTSRVYLCLDGHRSDDDNPHVYVSEDHGKNWTSIRGNLPWGSTRVLREDNVNANLLYCGTEFGIYASVDRGKSWTKIHGKNFPTVAVHEVAQHRSSGEIVVATHGRSIWILDVTPLRTMSAESIAADASLYKPNDVVRWVSTASRGSSGGARRYQGQNPESSATIFYSLGKNARSVSLSIVDSGGNEVRKLETKNEAGLHSVTWDLRGQMTAQARARQEAQLRARFGADFERFRRFFRNRAPAVDNGKYTVKLVVDGKSTSHSFEVQPDPNYPNMRPQTRRRFELEQEFERLRDLVKNGKLR